MQESPERIARYHSQVVAILTGLAIKLHSDGPKKTGSSLGGQAEPLTEESYRDLYRQRRIHDRDLSAAFSHYADLQAAQALCTVGFQAITREQVYRIALLFDFPAIGIPPLNGLWDERLAFGAITPGLPFYLGVDLPTKGDEREAMAQLWASLATQMALSARPQTELDLYSTHQNSNIHESLRQQAKQELSTLIANLGVSFSLRDVVKTLSGVDILDSINPQLQQIYSSLHVTAPCKWTTTAHQTLGLYATWRALSRQDASLFLHQLPDWQYIIAELPDDAVSTIVLQLQRLDISSDQWTAYLAKLADELVAGLPNKPSESREPSFPMADFLAIRLTLDRLWLNQICHDVWKIEARTSSIQAYFEKNLSEFWVRLQLYQGLLPEYLSQQAETLITTSGSERQSRKDWQQLADSLLFSQGTLESTHHRSKHWRLFRLCQHLGLAAADVGSLNGADFSTLLAVLDGFTGQERIKVWQYAERHYYQQALMALLTDLQPGVTQPQLQLIHHQQSVGFRLNKPPSIIPKTHRYPDHPFLAYLWVFFKSPLVLAYNIWRILNPQHAPLAGHHADGNGDIDWAGLADFLQKTGLAKPYPDVVIFVASDSGSCDDKGLNKPFDFQTLATLLNKPETRQQLARYNVRIPANTGFITAEYDKKTAVLQWAGNDISTVYGR